MTTVSPASRARRAPRWSMQPSWSQRAPAPAARTSSITSRRAPERRGAAAEDVDEAPPPRDVLHAAVDHLPEDPLLAGIDGDEIIALLEEVARDAVRGAMGLGGKSHDRDAARPQQQAPRSGLVRVRG